MKCITLAQVECRSAGGTPAPNSLLGERGAARHTAVHRPVSDVDAAETLDRQTVWPTHRIRCFLQAQRCQRASGTG
jgi:hypothetical protein